MSHTALPTTTVQKMVDILQKLPYHEVADLLQQIVKEHQPVTIKQPENVVDESKTEAENNS